MDICRGLDPTIIQNSFDQAGITSNLVDHFHKQLRHFILNQEFIDDVEDDEAQNVNGFTSGEEIAIDDLGELIDATDEEEEIQTE